MMTATPLPAPAPPAAMQVGHFRACPVCRAVYHRLETKARLSDSGTRTLTFAPCGCCQGEGHPHRAVVTVPSVHEQQVICRRVARLIRKVIEGARALDAVPFEASAWRLGCYDARLVGQVAALEARRPVLLQEVAP